jgi:leucyl aminopeptidase
MFDNISTQDMRKDLTTFSNFKNRLYLSQYGAQASEWLHTQVCNIVQKSAASGEEKPSCDFFEHKFQQKSVIARIPGTSNSEEKQHIVILGAHIDSFIQDKGKSGFTDPELRAPAANDDGKPTLLCSFSPMCCLRLVRFQEREPLCCYKS